MLARTVLLTAAALVAFAGNSLLCRLALATGSIDAASFTGVRLASGAIVLAVIAAWLGRPQPRARASEAGSGSWWSGLALFLYAAPFSYAYLRLEAGIGALVLFAAVQTTMIAWGISRGERPRPRVWLGLAVALAGLFGLTLPGAAAPDPLALVVMLAAGAAWGVYSLRGRAAASPLRATAGNFARAVPLAAALALVVLLARDLNASWRGLALAATSGALASGVGYTLWYAALPRLTVSSAAILQLLVPVLAATGGVALLGEAATPRLLLSGGAILGGVALAVVKDRDRTRPGSRA